MKKFLNYFFMILGVIFFVLLCAFVYLWIVDPLGLGPYSLPALIFAWYLDYIGLN